MPISPSLFSLSLSLSIYLFPLSLSFSLSLSPPLSLLSSLALRKRESERHTQADEIYSSIHPSIFSLSLRGREGEGGRGREGEREGERENP